MDTTLGPYRFNYPDDGLAIYKLGDLVEQYFLCNEHFWLQVLCVGGEEVQVSGFDAYGGGAEGEDLEDVSGDSEGEDGLIGEIVSLSEHIDAQKGTAGQFQLIWMSVAELSQATRILEDKIRDLGDDKENKGFKKECQKLREAVMAARKWKQKEEMQDQCCCMNFSWWGCSCYCPDCSGVDCGGC